MINLEEWLLVGELTSPHGIKGELKIKPLSDFEERFTKSGLRWIEINEILQEIELVKGRKVPGKEVYIVSLKGINTRNEANKISGKRMYVSIKDRPNLSDGEYHLLDLVGLEVKSDKNNEKIGYVINLINSGNDLLEIELINGKKVLIPFVEEIIPTININEGWITLNPPPGLLNL